MDSFFIHWFFFSGLLLTVWLSLSMFVVVVFCFYLFSQPFLFFVDASFMQGWSENRLASDSIFHYENTPFICFFLLSQCLFWTFCHSVMMLVNVRNKKKLLQHEKHMNILCWCVEIHAVNIFKHCLSVRVCVFLSLWVQEKKIMMEKKCI